MPTLHLNNQVDWKKVWDTINGLKPTTKWSQYKRAEPLEKESLQKTLNAGFRNPDHTINRERLRLRLKDPAALRLHIAGSSPTNDIHIQFVPNYCNEQSFHRPLVIVENIETKDKF